ncbi:MAG: S8 family serine peptidase [Myxococcales bacterium]|nr:S8 family serine peptidase [Myxococcales bacterium]
MLRLVVTGSVLALHERLDVHPDYAGRGVVMGFVDSAFFPHADLVRPRDRLRALMDLTHGAPTPEDFLSVHAHVWHGTMTACCAAGSGHLSAGRYRGIAHEAELVLLKVQRSPGEPIEGKSVAAAMRAPLRHPELGIRVLNVSVGVPWDDPAATDVERAAAELAEAGVIVVAAAGNIEGRAPSPPASAASVLAVGGADDRNTPAEDDDRRWPSNAGARSNRSPKPDLLAPAARLPAPMVPGTLTAREAPHLFHLSRILEEAEQDIQFRHRRGLDQSQRDEAALARILDAVRERIEFQKYISPSYQHVDGTSFAAPIVSAVIAQMLEAAPDLSPADVREGLFATCRRLEGVPAMLQGAGIVEPRAAVEWAIQRSQAKSS